MSLRITRTQALIGVIAFVVAAGGAASAAGAASTRSANQKVLARCVRLLFGEAGAGATAAPGSADPQVAAEFSIFRALRTTGDTLPAARNLDQALGGAEATSYDPAASVRLDVPRQDGNVYVVPATLAAPVVPAVCEHARALAGFRAAFALRTEATGSGPGVCLISTHLAPIATPVATLPGYPTKAAARTVATAQCESLAEMASYLGLLGGGLANGTASVTLVPDGISSVSFVLANGRTLTGSVSGNLLTAPELSGDVQLTGATTLSRLERLLAAKLPVTITEDNAADAVVASYARPSSLIPAFAREALLLKRVLTGVGSVSGSSESSSTSCSARTHRCVAVVLSTDCDWAKHRCDTERRIVRYRYAGRRPPRGTTGGTPPPIAPIRGRVNEYLRHPKQVSLVLSSSPHRRVDLLLAVNCTSRHGEVGVASSAGGPQQVAVPSRTPIDLPTHASACDVDVLVVSSAPGPVHARLVSG